MKSDLNEKIKKYVNNKTLYIIVIIGIAFMLLPEVHSKEESKESTRTYGSYSDEERLSEMLSGIKGAGRVSVMITYYGTTSYDMAFDGRSEESQTETQKSRTQEKSVITDDGKPLIKGELYPKVKGAVIVAEGASDASVRRDITSAAVAALEIAPCRVCVLEGKERD